LELLSTLPQLGAQVGSATLPALHSLGDGGSGIAQATTDPAKPSAPR
jgi:hypothetical protein